MIKGFRKLPIYWFAEEKKHKKIMKSSYSSANAVPLILHLLLLTKIFSVLANIIVLVSFKLFWKMFNFVEQAQTFDTIKKLFSFTVFTFSFHLISSRFHFHFPPFNLVPKYVWELKYIQKIISHVYTYVDIYVAIKYGCIVIRRIFIATLCCFVWK